MARIRLFFVGVYDVGRAEVFEKLMKAQITTTYKIENLEEFVQYVEKAFLVGYILSKQPMPYQMDRILQGKRSEVDWVNYWDDNKEFQANTVVEIFK